VAIFAHPAGRTFARRFAGNTLSAVQAWIEFALFLGEALDHHLAGGIHWIF